MKAHAARVALFVTLIGLIHWRYEKHRAVERASGLTSVSLDRAREVFPDAAQWGATNSSGGRDVLAADGQPLGYVIETAPASDPFLGFSGSTNWLIGFDPHERIQGTMILSSGDTRDHVELIRRDRRFLSSWTGLSGDEAAGRSVDAVSGATLTSLAMLQGLRARLGRSDESLKFPRPPTLEDARTLFPTAMRLTVDSGTSTVWHAWGADQVRLGHLLRSSPAADSIVGYQGPTESWIGVSSAGRVIGVATGPSFDNEPYVGYVRGDEYFRHVFDGKSLEEVARADVKEAGIEGVSGATMTSLAVARGVVAAARRDLAERDRSRATAAESRGLWLRTTTTAAIVLVGLVMSGTRLRGVAWFRVSFQAVVIGYLGLVNGDLLSTALWVGWAKHGLPLSNAAGLLLLSAAALILPIAQGRNAYCAHLCPHGAVQQWLPRRWQTKRPMPTWLAATLTSIRPLLLGWIVLVAMTAAEFSLADIEPFDAYAWRAAAWPTVAVAVVGLAASVFWPMAYCRHGCPTGAILNYLRRHRRSGMLSRADGVAVACLALGGLLAALN